MPRSGIFRSGMAIAQSDSLNVELSSVPIFLQSNGGATQNKAIAKESVVIETVRQYFPETWLWDIYVAE